jgi:hypothetical protein
MRWCAGSGGKNAMEKPKDARGAPPLLRSGVKDGVGSTGWFAPFPTFDVDELAQNGARREAFLY